MYIYFLLLFSWFYGAEEEGKTRWKERIDEKRARGGFGRDTGSRKGGIYLAG